MKPSAIPSVEFSLQPTNVSTSPSRKSSAIPSVEFSLEPTSVSTSPSRKSSNIPSVEFSLQPSELVSKIPTTESSSIKPSFQKVSSVPSTPLSSPSLRPSGPRSSQPSSITSTPYHPPSVNPSSKSSGEPASDSTTNPATIKPSSKYSLTSVGPYFAPSSNPTNYYSTSPSSKSPIQVLSKSNTPSSLTPTYSPNEDRRTVFPSYDIMPTPPTTDPHRRRSYAPSAQLSFLSCNNDHLKFVLNIINNDDDPENDISWTLRSCTGENILNDTNIGIEACIEPGQYNFTIYDEVGDGICCKSDHRLYEIYLNDELIKEGEDFSQKETTIFSSSTSYNPDPILCIPTSYPSVTNSIIMYSQSPTLVPSVLQEIETISLSQFSVDLMFPLSRRLQYDMSSQQRNQLEQSLQYDQEEFSNATYILLYNAMMPSFSPMIAGLDISLKKLSDQILEDTWIVKNELRGEVSVVKTGQSFVDFLLDQMNEFVLEKLRGEEYLQVLQVSNDTMLASIIDVEVDLLNPVVGSSSSPEKTDNDQSYSQGEWDYVFISLAAVIPIILVGIIYYLMRQSRRANSDLEDPCQQFLDDCSISSPGSRVAYKNNGVFHEEKGDDTNAASDVGEDTLDNELCATEDFTNETSCDREEEMKHQPVGDAESGSHESSGLDTRFDKLWDSSDASTSEAARSNERVKDNSQYSESPTVKSGNQSPQRRYFEC